MTARVILIGITVALSLMLVGLSVALIAMRRGTESENEAVRPEPTATQTPRPQATSDFGLRQRSMPGFTDDYVPPEGVEASAGGCGVGTSLRLANPDALGRTYRANQQLEIEIAFEAPGCTTAGARFYGYHGSRSRWYEYHCSDQACPERVYSTLTVNPLVPLSGTSGTVTIAATSGPFPPPTLFTQPPVEGFRFCFAEVTFSDGIWGGTYYVEWFSHPCDVPTLSPNDRT